MHESWSVKPNTMVSGVSVLTIADIRPWSVLYSMREYFVMILILLVSEALRVNCRTSLRRAAFTDVGAVTPEERRYVSDESESLGHKDVVFAVKRSDGGAAVATIAGFYQAVEGIEFLNCFPFVKPASVERFTAVKMALIYEICIHRLLFVQYFLR